MQWLHNYANRNNNKNNNYCFKLTLHFVLLNFYAFCSYFVLIIHTYSGVCSVCYFIIIKMDGDIIIILVYGVIYLLKLLVTWKLIDCEQIFAFHGGCSLLVGLFRNEGNLTCIFLIFLAILTGVFFFFVIFSVL